MDASHPVSTEDALTTALDNFDLSGIEKLGQLPRFLRALASVCSRTLKGRGRNAESLECDGYFAT